MPASECLCVLAREGCGKQRRAPKTVTAASAIQQPLLLLDSLAPMRAHTYSNRVTVQCVLTHTSS